MNTYPDCRRRLCPKYHGAPFPARCRYLLFLALWLCVPSLTAPLPAAAQAGPSAVVTNCRSFTASGSQGTGLLTALGEGAQVVFACKPALSGGPGPYTIDVTATMSITTPTSIDGADNGAHDVTLSGGGVRQIFQIQPRGALTLARLTLSQGDSAGGTGFGGAIEADGDLTVIDCTFADNHSDHLGGAIDLASNRPSTHLAVLISGTTFTGNTATGYGGAIEADATGAAVVVVNSTFVANEAGEGGAIRNGVSRITIANSTFDANTAPNGSVFSNSASLTIRNSILANSPDPCSGYALITDGGYNLEYPEPAPTYCGFSSARGDLFADPQLGSLAANGGPTQTELPGPGSPVIDAGDPAGCVEAGQGVSVDQRELSRPYPAHGRCDIGAVEVQPVLHLQLASSINPADIGQPVTITATVVLTTTTQQPAGGTVNFALANPGGMPTPLGRTSLDLKGSAIITATGTLFSQPGSYTISATYSGDSRYPSLAASQIQAVRPCTIAAGMRTSAGRLDILATTPLTSMAYRVDFTTPTGFFTTRNATISTCAGGNAGSATATLNGVLSLAGGIFAPGDHIVVRLVSGAKAAVTVEDDRARFNARLSSPFGVGSYLRITR